jgi:hypothetical protein
VRIVWKAPLAIAAFIAAVLLIVTRSTTLANVLFVIVGAVLLGFAIVAVGSWPRGDGGGP